MKYRVVISAALLSISTTALAQANAAADEPQGLQDIVVTAEKRETTLQRTPMSISVVTAEDVRRNGISNVQDLITGAPGVTLNTASNSAIISVRGISSRDTTEIGDPAVAISIDGQYLQRSIGLNDSVFDLERVEILRGPQGTLYGRNATGGAINFITAKPSKDFKALASVTIGNYSTLATEGMVNIPLADTVQMRAAFSTRRHDGYRDNAPAADGDDQDSQSARVHLAMQPTDRLDLLLTGEYSHLGGVGPTYFGAPLQRDANGEIIHEQPQIPSKGKRFALNLPDQRQDIDIYSGRWQATYDLDIAKLTYLGSYRRLNFNRLFDLDGTATSALAFDASERLRTWSHEVRLNSQGDGPFRWQAGLFSFNEHNNLLATFLDYSTAAAGTKLFIFQYPDISSKSKAAFAQAAFKISPALEIEGGIRYSDDRKNRKGTAFYLPVAVPADEAYKGNRWTFHGAVNYTLPSGSLLYAKFDTGYKAGGFTDVASYGPETIKAWEVGSKNRFFDNRLQFNVSGFYYDYTGQQISQFANGVTTIFNAGKSRVYGGDVEMAVQVTPEDRFDGFVSYLNAQFTEFCTVRATPCPATNNFKGNVLPQAPRWQLSGAYQHEFAMPGGALTARIQTRYESETYLTFFQRASERNGGYTRTDATLTYRADKGWGAELFVRNLENSTVFTAASEQDFFGTYTYQFAAPRTFGARVFMNW